MLSHRVYKFKAFHSYWLVDEDVIISQHKNAIAQPYNVLYFREH